MATNQNNNYNELQRKFTLLHDTFLMVYIKSINLKIIIYDIVSKH